MTMIMSLARILISTECNRLLQEIYESLTTHQRLVENAYATLLLQRPLMAGIFFSTTGVGIWLLTTPSIPLLTLASAGFGVYTVINESLAWLETTHTELLRTILKPIYTRLEYESSLPPVLGYQDICLLLQSVWARGQQMGTEIATLKQRYPTLYLPAVCAISFYVAIIGMQIATTTLTYILVYGVSLIPAIYHYRVIQNCESLVKKVVDEYVNEAALDDIISRIPLRSLDTSQNQQNRKERKKRHTRSLEYNADDNKNVVPRALVSSALASPPQIESIPTTIPVVQEVTEAIAVDHNRRNKEVTMPLSESICDEEWEKDFDVIDDDL